MAMFGMFASLRAPRRNRQCHNGSVISPGRASRLRTFQPGLELLEPRCLLASWAPIGPAPQLPIGNPANPALLTTTGRVSALAFSPDSRADRAAEPRQAPVAASLLGAAGPSMRKSNATVAAQTFLW